MTESEFIDELFGEGWTQEQLPLFLEIVKQFDLDSKRYHQLRDMVASEFEENYIPTREELYEVDSMVDKARARTV